MQRTRYYYLHGFQHKCKLTHASPWSRIICVKYLAIYLATNAAIRFRNLEHPAAIALGVPSRPTHVRSIINLKIEKANEERQSSAGNLTRPFQNFAGYYHAGI